MLWGLAWASTAYASFVWLAFVNAAANKGQRKLWRQFAWRYAILDGVAAVAWIAMTLLMVQYVWSPRRRYTFAVKPGMGDAGGEYGGCNGYNHSGLTRTKDLHLDPDLWEPFNAWPAEQLGALSRVFGLVFALCLSTSVLFLATALFYFFYIPGVVRGLRACNNGFGRLLTRGADMLFHP